MVVGRVLPECTGLVSSLERVDMSTGPGPEVQAGLPKVAVWLGELLGRLLLLLPLLLDVPMTLEAGNLVTDVRLVTYPVFQTDRGDSPGSPGLRVSSWRLRIQIY